MSPNFKLEKYKGPASKHTCPQCGGKRTFKRYLNSEGNYVADHVGICDRLDNCGYHYPPRQYFADHGIERHHATTHCTPPQIKEETIKPPIPIEVVKGSLSKPEENNFIRFLSNRFGARVARDLTDKYFLGTSNDWRKGAVAFYNIDRDGIVWYGKVMSYDSEGKRLPGANSVHSLLKIEGDTYKKIFFGEHLLTKFPELPVAIVEAPKTAVIASVYFPDLIWVAAGGLSWLTSDRMMGLIDRTVILYPDLGKAEIEWKEKAKSFQRLCKVSVSPLLGNIATEDERREGLDLADFLLRFHPDEFKPKETAIHTEHVSVESVSEVPEETPVTWDQEIEALEKYFSGIKIPQEEIKLSEYQTVTDVNKFVQSHLSTVKRHNGKFHYTPYLNRLQELQGVLIAKGSY